jgi:hypothetical protein
MPQVDDEIVKFSNRYGFTSYASVGSEVEKTETTPLLKTPRNKGKKGGEIFCGNDGYYGLLGFSN